jgi:hypothetical protein
MSSEMSNDFVPSRQSSKSSVLSPDEPLPFYTDEQLAEMKVMMEQAERRNSRRPSISELSADMMEALKPRPDRSWASAMLPRCVRRQA